MAHTTHALPTDTAHANGAASLSERVKGLRLGDQLATAKTSRGSSWLPWVLCLLMAITWASFAIRAYTAGGFKNLLGDAPETTTSSAPSPGGSSPKTEKKTTAPVSTPAADEMVLEVKGYIIPAHQIQVSPVEVSGRIIHLAIEEGKFFKKGSTLAELDATPYEADYREAAAALASAEARLKELKESWPREIEQAKAQLEEAIALRDQYEKDYKRYQEIGATGVAAKEFDQAKFGYLTQSARVKQMEATLKLIESSRQQRIEAADAEVKAAKARADRSKWRLDNTKIVAPVDGIVLSKRAEIGNLLNALAMNATLNGGICDMADLTDLEVDLEVQERDIHKVEVGYACTVRADAYPNRIYPARVDRIMPIANSSKAVIPVRVKVRVPRSEEGKYLKPQMGAVVNFYNRPAPPETDEPVGPKIVE